MTDWSKRLTAHERVPPGSFKDAGFRNRHACARLAPPKPLGNRGLVKSKTPSTPSQAKRARRLATTPRSPREQRRGRLVRPSKDIQRWGVDAGPRRKKSEAIPVHLLAILRHHHRISANKVTSEWASGRNALAKKHENRLKWLPLSDSQFAVNRLENKN